MTSSPSSDQLRYALPAARTFDVVEVAAPYATRGTGRQVRLYLEVRLP